jgi:predicted NUDIX family NTP pyrophosphohydrolase
MPKLSAGILLFRFIDTYPEILLFHPGGPYWEGKNVWTIAKGIVNENEQPLDTAKRELEKETGIRLKGKLIALTPLKQRNNKTVFAWGVEQDFDPA